MQHLPQQAVALHPAPAHLTRAFNTLCVASPLQSNGFPSPSVSSHLVCSKGGHGHAVCPYSYARQKTTWCYCQHKPEKHHSSSTAKQMNEYIHIRTNRSKQSSRIRHRRKASPPSGLCGLPRRCNRTHSRLHRCPHTSCVLTSRRGHHIV